VKSLFLTTQRRPHYNHGSILRFSQTTVIWTEFKLVQQNVPWTRIKSLIKDEPGSTELRFDRPWSNGTGSTRQAAVYQLQETIIVIGW